MRILPLKLESTAAYKIFIGSQISPWIHSFHVVTRYRGYPRIFPNKLFLRLFAFIVMVILGFHWGGEKSFYRGLPANSLHECSQVVCVDILGAGRDGQTGKTGTSNSLVDTCEGNSGDRGEVWPCEKNSNWFQCCEVKIFQCCEVKKTNNWNWLHFNITSIEEPASCKDPP